MYKRQELSAKYGEMNLSAQDCCVERNYWLGSDGVLYKAGVLGMEMCIRDSYGIVGALLACLVIACYDGTRGFIHGKVAKYGFYAFYPVHLILLVLIEMCIRDRLKAYKALFLTDTPIKSCFSMICPKPNIRSSFLQRGYG